MEKKASPLVIDTEKRNVALICTSFANVLTKRSSFTGCCVAVLECPTFMHRGTRVRHI